MVHTFNIPIFVPTTDTFSEQTKIIQNGLLHISGQTNMPYNIGDNIFIEQWDIVNSDFMSGTIIGYTGSTGEIIANITNLQGSGSTYKSWHITLTGNSFDVWQNSLSAITIYFSGSTSSTGETFASGDTVFISWRPSSPELLSFYGKIISYNQINDEFLIRPTNTIVGFSQLSYNRTSNSIWSLEISV